MKRCHEVLIATLHLILHPDAMLFIYPSDPPVLSCGNGGSLIDDVQLKPSTIRETPLPCLVSEGYIINMPFDEHVFRMGGCQEPL